MEFVMEFVGAAIPLSDDDINAEAQKLGIEPATIWAVCDVESAGSGFLPDKRPKILFEAHYFHTLTQGRFDRSHPNISSPTWDRSLYGATGAHQYDRLAEAISLNREAALESASWGRFQIMGANFKQCNYADVETFVNAMCASEANHLHAFSNFCSNGGLISYLKNHDWAHFALHYNGPGQVQYYANMIQNAYNRHLNSNPNSSSNDILKKGMRGYAVILLQTQLKNLGYSLVEDGIFGDDTENAVKALQKKYNIVSDGIVGKQTKSIIEIEIAQKKVPPTIGKAS